VTNFEPSYCGYCGTELGVVDPPQVFQCADCDRYLFHSPTPGASVVVVRDDAVLLVERADAPGTWCLPGGHVDHGESPSAAAARELEEETALAVDPAALTYLEDSCVEPVDGKAMVGVDYATRFDATTGTPSAGTDATAVEWFTTDSFRARTGASLHRATVAKYGTDLDALVAAARDATSVG
jgi:ADP-ribose pyrophosphatase YjhB (NUDIX family)